MVVVLCVCVASKSGEQELKFLRVSNYILFKISVVSHSVLSFLRYGKICSFQSLELSGHAYN